MLRPINRRILVNTLEQKAMERYGNLVVPQNTNSMIKEGIVEKIGLIHEDEEEILVKEGDRILFITSGHVFTREGKEYRIIDEDSIIAIVEENKEKIITEKVKATKEIIEEINELENNDIKPDALKEGSEKSSGIKEPPIKPKPDINPAPQNPE